MSYLTQTISAVPASPSANKMLQFASSVNRRQHTVDENGLVLSYGPCISSTTAATAGLNTTETIVAGGNAQNGGTCLIPANFFQVGSTYRITLNGTCTSTVGNVSTFTGRFGGAGTGFSDATLFTATVTAQTSGTAVPFKVVIEFTVRTTGATGTIAGSAEIVNQGTTGISTLTINVVPLTVSAVITTSQAYLSVTYKSAATTTTCTFQQGLIEVLR